MTARSASGFLVGKARLGYEGVRTECGTMAKSDPATLPLVREAFRMASRGEGLRSIAAWLRSRGLSGTRGKPVALSTVQRVVTAPYYAGMTEWNGCLVPGRLEALVTRELFDAA
jgi:hypothetical protein